MGINFNIFVEALIIGLLEKWKKQAETARETTVRSYHESLSRYAVLNAEEKTRNNLLQQDRKLAMLQRLQIVKQGGVRRETPIIVTRSVE